MADDGLSFSRLLDQFWSMLDALSELAEAVTPHAASLEEQASVQLTITPPPERQDELRAALDELLTPTGEALEPVPTSDSGPVASPPGSSEGPKGDPAAIAPDANRAVDNDAAAPMLSRDQAERFVEAIRVAFDDDPMALRQLAFAFDKVSAPRPRHTAILNGALLTMSVGALETLVAGLVGLHFRVAPSALESQDKEFSLSDLLTLPDLDAAREVAIRRRVEDVMRGGLDDWTKWFQGRLGDGVLSLPEDGDALTEVIQRRHLVVHNASRVSQIYCSKTQSQIPVGTELVSDRDYLARAIDQVEVFGTRLGLLAWVKWGDPVDGAAAQFMNQRVFEVLASERWSVAKSLAHTAGRLKAPEQLRWFLKVNEWQATKRVDGPDSIRQDVRDWDTTALSPVFALAKAALLDDFDTLFRELPTAVTRKDLDRKALEVWPLFRELRAHPDGQAAITAALAGSEGDGGMT